MIPEIQYRRLVEHFKDRVSDRDCCNGNNIVGGTDVEIRFLEGEPPSRTQATNNLLTLLGKPLQKFMVVLLSTYLPLVQDQCPISIRYFMRHLYV